ncbi:MAG: LOG family protein [Propionicimonas sp.]|nr:LOG family protein [Propionicimonas sp.]
MSTSGHRPERHPSRLAQDGVLESLDELRAHLRATGSLADCSIQAVDLRGETTALLAAEVRNAVFLGCILEPEIQYRLQAAGALFFPRLPDLPFDPYRAALYRPDELYHGLAAGYDRTLDARVYRWWRHIGRHRSLASELAMTLHDHAISDALADLDLPSPVGVMGGHRTSRDGSDYRAAAVLGRALAGRGHTVLTGGGPGAMEAVNLGAAFAGSAADLDEAIAVLAAHPGFGEDTDGWARASFEVRQRWPLGGPSIGVPTWFYGHEPANAFATAVAKFVSNALREDILLRLATAGLICLPGAAGTVQEIFQALTPRYYAEREVIPPLVLVGTDHWRHTLPAWPLVDALARGRAMAGHVFLCETVDEALAVLQ